MSVNFGYRRKAPATVEEIADLLQRARLAFPDYREFNLTTGMLASRRVGDTLVQQEVPPGLNWLSTIIDAGLPASATSPDLFRRMLEEAFKAWPDRAYFSIQFEVQRQDHPDGLYAYVKTFGMGIRNGLPFVLCSDSRDSDKQGVAAMRQTLAAQIDDLNLPMTIKDRRIGYCLEHMSGCNIFTCSDYTVSLFQCPLPGASIAYTASVMDRIAQNLPGRWTSRCAWHAANPIAHNYKDESELMLGKRMYDWAREMNFPMESGTVESTLGLKSIEGLHHIHKFSGPRNRCYSPLCSFRVAKEEWARIAVRTRYRKHYIDVDLSDFRYRRKVEKALGLETRSTGAF